MAMIIAYLALAKLSNTCKMFVQKCKRNMNPSCLLICAIVYLTGMQALQSNKFLTPALHNADAIATFTAFQL